MLVSLHRTSEHMNYSQDLYICCFPLGKINRLHGSASPVLGLPERFSPPLGFAIRANSTPVNPVVIYALAAIVLGIICVGLGVVSDASFPNERKVCRHRSKAQKRLIFFFRSDRKMSCDEKQKVNCRKVRAEQKTECGQISISSCITRRNRNLSTFSLYRIIYNILYIKYR